MQVIGTAGHVDHGKSTLVEKLTGIDPDRFDEEKRRGLTIDLGFAWLPTPSGREIGIIDVPGHERFIKNMLAGTGGISVCLFVVAANEGWMPQSTEHLAILDVLGIEHGVVAITKSDLVDGETLEIVLAETRERLVGTSLARAATVACSAMDGTGLSALVRALDEAVDAAGRPEDLGRPRLWIDRVFTISGAGTVVTGTLAGGGLKTGEAIEISPAGSRARIRTIQSHKKQTPSAGPGQRVALNLSGLDRTTSQRGHAVVRPGAWRPSDRVDALVRVSSEEVTGVRHELVEKGAHLLYCGTAETPVRISLPEGAIGPGEEGFARLWLRDKLPLARGDRFVLRDAGRVLTFGGGRVLDPLPDRQVPLKDRLGLIRQLVEATPDEALVALVDAEESVERSLALLRSGATTVPDSVVELDTMLVSPDRYSRLRKSIVQELRIWHEHHPLEKGMLRESLRTVLGLEPGEFDALLVASDEVVGEGNRVRLVSFGIRLDPQQESERQRTIETIEGAGFSPPLRNELNVPEHLLRALVESQELVPMGDFFLTKRQAIEARRTVRDAITSRGPVTVAQIRDLLGTTRKYAVPLCEWLDGSGATRRRGDERVLGPNA